MNFVTMTFLSSRGFDPMLCNLIIGVLSDQVTEHSHAVNMWCKELCALDCVYREVLPHLWFNANTKTVHTVKCKPPKVGRHQPECSGEASIVMEVGRGNGTLSFVSWNTLCYEALYLCFLYAL